MFDEKSKKNSLEWQKICYDRNLNNAEENNDLNHLSRELVMLTYEDQDKAKFWEKLCRVKKSSNQN